METPTTYQYQWGKRDDAAHRISNLTDLRGIEGFIRQCRPNCPWQIRDQATGRVLFNGTGPDAPLALYRV